MSDTSFLYLDSMRGFVRLFAGLPMLFFVCALYNIYFHPLRHVPGPFWARASDIPSWYYTARGTRHIWLWQQFQIYGKRIRIGPNLVLFCDPEAFTAIYSTKSNVQRSPFYVGLTKNIREITTLNTIDPAKHAKRRKMLNTCFTEASVNSISTFLSKHIDRWLEIMLAENNTADWSISTDFSEKLDHLVFDIMGDICFGKSFNIKEPGDNPLREVPSNIVQYLKFYYPLIEIFTPKAVRQFNAFVFDSVTARLQLYKEQLKLPEKERRRDMFYFLCSAEDTSTGRPAYTEEELRAEASLLIIAGSDTTSASLASIFWYLSRYPRSYQKLVDEMQEAFQTTEDIVYGPQLLSCIYLRACIDEGMRLVPPGPCEPPREILAGGLVIMGNYYPQGTIVGTAPWCDSRNEEVYGDAGVFRPERWIPDEATGVTKEMVAEIRSNFHPFLAGPGSCAGRSIALAEIMLVVAKTLHRFELRKAPGSTLGEGRPDMGWGAQDRKQFQVIDAYISLKQGPELQFRKRAAQY